MHISKHWVWAALPLIVIGVGLPVAAQFGSVYRGYAFLGVLVLLGAELAIIGWLINNRPIGAFVDNRNRISLSKLQAGAWTVVMIRPLGLANDDDKSLKEGGVYNIGFAVHDDNITTRGHQVSFVKTIGFGAKAGIQAVKLP